MLPILNLSKHNLLHYYESRDDGLYHVIRAMDGNTANLDRIAESTGFKQDIALLYNLPTVSMKKDSFSHADAHALKSLFPDTKMFNMNSHHVTFDSRTINVDKRGYVPKSKNSYFSKNATLELWPYESDIEKLILGKLNQHSINNDAITLTKQTMTVAVERFNNGELSHDTWPIWQIFFDAERGKMSSRDIWMPIWKPFFARMNQHLELMMHPGAHRLYKITSDADSINRITSSDEIYASGRNPGTLITEHEVERASFFGLRVPRDIQHLTVNKELTPAKGIIEIKRDPDTGISMFANLKSIPIGIRARLFDSISSSVTVNMRRAQQIREILEDLSATIKSKPSQQVLSEKILANTKQLNAVINAKEEIPLSAMKNNHLVFASGMITEIAAVAHMVDNRHTRLSRLLQRSLLRSENIVDINARKTLIQNAIDFHIEALRDIAIIPPSEKDGEDNVKTFFANINKKISSTDISRIFHSDTDHNAIVKATTSYLSALEASNQAALTQQKEAVRAAIRPIQLNDEVSRNEYTDEIIDTDRETLYNNITSKSILELTADEQIKYAVKQNIWTKPDYEGLIALGIKPSDVHFIKIVRDAIESRPQKLTRAIYNKATSPAAAETKEDYIYWLAAMEYIRDRFNSIGSEDDFRLAIDDIAVFLDKPVDEEYKPKSGHYDDSITNLHALGASFKAKFGYRKSFQEMYAAHNSIDGLSDSASLKRLGIRTKADTDIEVNANKSAQEHASTENQPEKSKLKLPIPEQLQALVRVGNNWRNDKDVTEDDMINVFGFRDVERSSWISSIDRQNALNQAFDAFMDLAYALGLPQDNLTMISMESELAMGFWDQEHGCGQAHYDSTRDVIHITKIAGAGLLATAWFHAFDAYMGRQTNTGHIGQRLYSEAVAESRRADIKAKMKGVTDESILRLATTIDNTVMRATLKPRTQKHVDTDIAEAYSKAAMQLSRLSQNVAYKFLNSTDDSSTRLLPQKHKTVRILKEAKLDSVRPLEHRLIVAKIAAMQVMEANDTLRDFYAKDTQRLINIMLPHIGAKCQNESMISLKWLRNEIIKAKDNIFPAETDFLADAKRLDGKSSHYWQKPSEMLARSFSVAVYDKLQAEGRQSDYLVRGAAKNEFANKNKYKGNCNPEGDERDTLNEHHAKLFDAISYHAQSLMPFDDKEGMSM